MPIYGGPQQGADRLTLSADVSRVIQGGLSTKTGVSLPGRDLTNDLYRANITPGILQPNFPLWTEHDVSFELRRRERKRRLINRFMIEEEYIRQDEEYTWIHRSAGNRKPIFLLRVCPHGGCNLLDNHLGRGEQMKIIRCSVHP